MTKLPSHVMIQRLIYSLEEDGLLQGLSLDDEDIADSIWLALQIGVIDTSPPSNTGNQETNVVKFDDIEKQPPVSQSSQQKPVVNVYPQPPKLDKEPDKKSETTKTSSGFPFPVPAAPAIQNSLEIGRSMRPLKRKYPSKTRFSLDEEATVNRIIEHKIWSPVTKPEPERWLSLELVVEESRSAFIWQEIVDDFQQILENHGAFANVRVWTIKYQNNQTENSGLILTRRRKRGKISQRHYHHRQLIHADKRGLTLLISDCVSPLWQNSSFYQWLKDWSTSQPTAIVQLFPERLWESTQLSLGRKLFAKSFNPGVINSQLILDDLPVWLPINWDDTLVLPVLNLEPQILKLWTRVVAGFSNSRISTYLFDLEFLNQNLKNFSPPKKEDLNSPEFDEAEQAKIIVTRFLATASPIAQRLAGMMAAVPVDISVVNLIRKTRLQEAQPVHVAEVYMGGLLQAIQEDTEGKVRVYDFIPGVRKVLNQAMAINQTEAVLDAVSKYIGDRIGLSITTFTALIDLLPESNDDNREKILPFAKIGIDVLQNIGGEYADLANSLLPKITSNSRQEPELKTCDFEVASIEIFKTTTFNFVVATLERKSKRSNWVVKRQEKQRNGIIEKLSAGLNLELMEIPEGTFLMGSPTTELDQYDDESPQHEVTVPTFFMGKYPITQAQWREVAGWEQIDKELNPDPSRFKDNYKGTERWTRPVERVSWLDAKEFCARLSQKTQREYRLPTEAEWEYACRAGTSTPFHFGETITTELANYDGNSVYGDGVKGEYRRETTPVGYFGVGNNFGLYDMHGNVWEWCEDDWHGNYKNAPTDGIVWIGQSDFLKVLRGGSWSYNARNCRCASRNFNSRTDMNNFNGFRVVQVAART